MERTSKEVNLTIDSRIISHLGEALIDNEKIALLELIKNSSDADANNCYIEIDTLYKSQYGQGRIIIEDDGNGMTPHIIENAFLKIATSFKANYQKVSPKFKRQAQGNKGIGRLSLNQLGRFVSVDTKVDLELSEFMSQDELTHSLGYSTKSEFVGENDFYYYHIDIDWERYSNANKSVENVKLDLQTSLFNESIFSHNKNHGTRIEVLGLKGIDFWQSTQIQKEIEQDVLEFLNPYLEEKYNFYVKINLDNKIVSSNKYDLADIENNFLSKADFIFSSKESKLDLHITRSKKYVDYKVKQLVSKLNEWELDQIEEIPYKQYYKDWTHESLTFDLSSVLKANSSAPNVKFNRFIKFVVETSLDNGETTEKFFLPGDFRGVIYGFDLSHDSPVSKEFKKALEEIRGVKLYRNNFRIFPYGSKNNDWLEMSDYNQRVSGVIYKQHTATGFINIDGEENLERLKELTNRQGLVLDNYGTNFILLVKELIYRTIAKNDRSFTEFFTFNRKDIKNRHSGEIIEISGMKFKKRHDDIEEAESRSDNLTKNYLELDDSERKREVVAIQKAVQNLRSAVSLKEKQVAELEKHVESFAPIMGATIVAETLAHEIIRLSNSVKSYSSKARKAVVNDKKEEALTSLSGIDSSIKFLQRYASLLDVNSYSRRRRYSTVDIEGQLQRILKDSPLLTYGTTTITYKIQGKSFNVRLVEDSFKIIIENMVINSSYWLDKMQIKDPRITFNLDTELGKLTIFDNGLGVDKSVENHLFQEFVTNKPDNDGRGMGLYIVTTLLHEIGATIELDSERNEFDNLYKFVITFPEEGI
ncbi:TPA: ATP-binding protein [Streptococcus suis]